MTTHTSDESILGNIQALVHEEQRLYGQGEVSSRDQVRLEQISAKIRPASVVEQYKQ